MIAEPGPDDLFGLVFTSGTSGAPKAVRVTHRAMAMSGELIAGTFGLTDADVVYLAMPLFHSNALMASFAPALASGATIAPRPRFSASEFLSDVRRYGVTYFGYVGKPLAYILDTPVEADDADNPVRLAFGNEASPADVAAFSERFGCMVLDGYGSTELAVTIRRDAETPPQSIGKAFPGVAILDPETGEECPPARFDDDGTVLDLDACVGEIVNTGGAGLFGGYHRDPQATAERMRDGMYWSGDLAYADEQGNVYLVGRSGDWVRVDGENMACGVVEAILLRDPALAQAVVYGVPDPRGVGDQLVAALVPRAGGALVPRDLEEFLAAQPDLSTKAWPRWVRVCRSLPTTATNKVLKRELAAHGFAPAGGPDEWWERDERGRGYSPMA